jgi:hypothetical protein
VAGTVTAVCVYSVMIRMVESDAKSAIDERRQFSHHAFVMIKLRHAGTATGQQLKKDTTTAKGIKAT